METTTSPLQKDVETMLNRTDLNPSEIYTEIKKLLNSISPNVNPRWVIAVANKLMLQHGFIYWE